MKETIRIFTICALSLIVTALFYHAEGWIVPGGSAMFFTWGEALFTHRTLPPDFAQRDLGFPFLIWLSGYPWTHSIRGIALVYAAFGALMPPLTYWTIRPFGAWLAWLTAIFVIVSCAPWLFAKFFYHDQTCIFASVLALTFLGLYLAYEHRAWLWLFLAAAIFASISRPAMNAVFPCLMFVAIAFGPRRHWWSILGCIAVFGLSLLAYQTYRSHVFDTARLGYTPSYAGEQIFYDAYVNAEELGYPLNDLHAPRFDLLRAALHRYLGQPDKLAEAIEAEPQSFQANFRYPDLEQRIWQHPNYEYALFLDGVASDDLLLGAALDIYRAWPAYAVRVVARNLWHFVFFPGFAHTRYNLVGYTQTGLQFYPAGSDSTEISLFPSVAQAEMRTSPDPVLDLIAPWWMRLYQPFIFASSLLVLMGWAAICSAPRLHSRAFIGIFLAATGLFVYNALIVSAFAEPDYRYQGMILVLRIALCGFALIAIKPKNP
jgi:hypothetical protein